MSNYQSPAEESAEWWSTAITSIQPNEISIRGYRIEDLIGRVSFSSAVSLMVLGELPSRDSAELLEAAMVASVDHGPQAPSIATARMAASCGVPFNGIIAAGVSLLGDVHGGAGQQCMALLAEVNKEVEDGANPSLVVRRKVTEFLERGEFIPGFGHRFHSIDPRAVRLEELVNQAKTNGVVKGNFMEIGSLLENELTRQKNKRMPTNIDGATAIVYSELGFDPEVGRALFILSRSVGIIANAWEEKKSGSRLKGPVPSSIVPKYKGLAPRSLPFPER